MGRDPPRTLSFSSSQQDESEGWSQPSLLSWVVNVRWQPSSSPGELFLATEETLTPQDVEPRVAGRLCLGPFLHLVVSTFPTALHYWPQSPPSQNLTLPLQWSHWVSWHAKAVPNQWFQFSLCPEVSNNKSLEGMFFDPGVTAEVGSFQTSLIDVQPSSLEMLSLNEGCLGT